MQITSHNLICVDERTPPPPSEIDAHQNRDDLNGAEAGGENGCTWP